MPATGGEARAVTNVAGGAAGPVWSADGRRILFSSSVAPAGDSLAKRLERLAAMKSEAKIYDEVGYRHWDEWEDGQRSHVFVLDVASGATRDVTPGPYDTPPIALEGFQDYSISPDGREVAFVRNTDPQTMVATGNDVWLVSADGGEPPSSRKRCKRYIADLLTGWPLHRLLGMTRAGFDPIAHSSCCTIVRRSRSAR
jgi:dipeptidyl aminopeptidase/acylaminoacyl peptidase